MAILILIDVCLLVAHAVQHQTKCPCRTCAGVSHMHLSEDSKYKVSASLNECNTGCLAVGEYALAAASYYHRCKARTGEKHRRREAAGNRNCQYRRISAAGEHYAGRSGRSKGFASNRAGLDTEKARGVGDGHPVVKLNIKPSCRTPPKTSPRWGSHI